MWVRFTWKRNGDGWRLYYDRRKFGRVVPDTQYRGMWRSSLHNIGLSDIANLSRARDAAMRAAIRELEYEHRQQATCGPRIPSEIKPILESISPHSNSQEGPATTLHEPSRQAA